MKYDNEMTLTVNASSNNESFSRSVVAAFCVQLNPTIEEIGDIKTAVSEAVTNCVVHGYNNAQKGKIELFVGIIDKTVTIRIVDQGKGIEDVSKAMQPFFTSGVIDERSGMGFTVMQALMDEVKVNSKPNLGTTVVMKKEIKSSSTESINA